MYLGQRIPVWSLDTKENKYSWPWNITLVLWFLIHSKGQMSRFPQASSKTIIMIKNDKMTRKMIPAKQDTEDDFCVTLVLGGTTIGSRCITPTQWSYKKWQVTTSPATGTTSALTKERLWEHPNEGSVPEFTTWCGLWRPRRGSSAKSLRGTRDGLIWEQVLGVCVCVLGGGMQRWSWLEPGVTEEWTPGWGGFCQDSDRGVISSTIEKRLSISRLCS